MTEDEEILCVNDIMNSLRTIFQFIHDCPEHFFYISLVLLHKYLRKVAIQKFSHDKHLVSTACLLLASKVENAPLKLAKLAAAFHKAQLKRHGLPAKQPSAHQLFQIQSALCLIESEVLTEIGFDFDVELPYRYIQEYGEYEADGIGEVVQVASCICNDTFIMPLCLYYHPMQIACGCIYFSTLHLKTPLPNFGGNPWYKFLHSEIEFAHVQEIANYLKHIYKKIGERRGKGSVKQCPYTCLLYTSPSPRD
eukprot:TRINITY_DN4042_c0_g1_i32.p1 TRINITY_DN4042_c0_g1~~TRINITY_DN4042_c0_g1_i32.p1  ORF type:complete len:251 (-),score=38.91 TRINITY_DN4042_c0_g1_i32:53-805(-)